MTKIKMTTLNLVRMSINWYSLSYFVGRSVNQYNHYCGKLLHAKTWMNLKHTKLNLKKLYTKQYVLYDSIYMKSYQVKLIYIEVIRTVASLAGGSGTAW